MVCLIFGGGGFIGSAIAERLILDGYKVRIFDRKGAKDVRNLSSIGDVEWMSGDLSSPRDLETAISGAEIIVHSLSATLPKSSNENPIYDVQANLIGFLKTLDAAVAKKVRKIVFISSGGTVYGNVKYCPIDEHHPTNPLVSYGVTKLSMEKYLTIYQRSFGLQSISLRVSNPFGEWQRVEKGQGAVGVFLSRALTNQTIDIWGDGTAVRDFMHVEDVATAVVRAVKYSGDHQVFNISSGEGTSLNLLVKIIENTLGFGLNLSYHAPRQFDAPVSILSNELAKVELNWEPKISLVKGIQRTAQWMRTHLLTSNG